jgi:probable phosphoglycerate mutase
LKLYITRHGETEWNREGRMQGWQNSNLTEKGVENAKRLGDRLRNIEFDCIYCSPLGRAVDTAMHIKGNKNTEIIFKEALKEMGFGCWEGVEHEEVMSRHPEQRHNFWHKPHLYKPVDGESYEELLLRVRTIFDGIIGNTQCENVLIVTHAAVIKAIYSIIKNSSLEEFWGEPYMYDTCLTVLEIANGEIKCMLEADTSHLE